MLINVFLIIELREIGDLNQLNKMVDVENKSNMKYLIIKWCGKEYKIEWSENDTISTLKSEIHRQTGVRPDRQKLLNLKLKGN